MIGTAHSHVLPRMGFKACMALITMMYFALEVGHTKSLPMPGAHVWSVRNDRQVALELEKLLRRVSFNIVRMEKSFTIAVFRERMEFQHLKPLGDEHKRYRVSTPNLNGILELKMEQGRFYDLRFWELAGTSPLTARVVHIDELKLRRR